jgi:soluble P-type ATPase
MIEMYTYRYHVLTIVGIFLALGIGLMLGTILTPEWMMRQQIGLLHRLEVRYDKLSSEYGKLKQQTNMLNVESRNMYHEMDAIGMHYAINKLTGKHVVIVNAGNVNTDSLAAFLQAAGGIVDGILTVNEVEQQTQHVGDGTDMKSLDWQTPESSQLAVSIGRVLIEPNQYQSQLQALVQTRVIKASKQIKTKPDAVVLVSGIYNEGIKSGKNRIERFDLVLADQLHKALPVVEVECSDSKNDTTWMYRKLGISTINNIDHIAGQIACIDILNGMHGHFGTGQAAEALLPDLHASKEVFQQ